jgi:hypothetical protein
MGKTEITSLFVTPWSNFKAAIMFRSARPMLMIKMMSVLSPSTMVGSISALLVPGGTIAHWNVQPSLSTFVAVYLGDADKDK